jgi:O-antigen/teichoic acid export membrane protein
LRAIQALAAGTAVNLTGIVVRAGLLFAHGAVAARWFGAAGYGLYTAGLALASLLGVACQLGLPRATTRFVAAAGARDDAAAQRRTLLLALRAVAPASVLVGAAVAAFAPAVARALGQPALGAILPWWAVAIPLMGLSSVLAGHAQGLGRMALRAVALDFVAPAIELAALVAFGVAGLSDRALPWAYLVALSTGTVWLAWACLRAPRESGAALPRGDAPDTAALARYALPLWSAALLAEAGNRAGVLLLSALAPPATVGVFGLLQRLVGLGGVFLHAVNGMLAPLVAWLVEQRALGELERLHRAAARWVLLVCLPSFCLLGFAAPFVLSLFGEEFVAGSSALVILSLGVLADLLGGSSGVILMMSGRPRCNAWNEAARLVLLAVLGCVLIPRLGLLGAAAAVALATSCFSLLQILEVHGYLKIHPFGSHLLKALGAAGIMSAVLASSTVGAAGAERPARFALFAAASVAAYVAALWTLGPAAEDRALIAAGFSRLRRSRPAASGR